MIVCDQWRNNRVACLAKCHGLPASGAHGPRGPRAQEYPNIYYYKIRVSFVKEILSFRSTFGHEIEKSSSIRDLADLLIIKNHFMSSCFPEVLCIAFLLFVIIPVTMASAVRSFSKLKLIKTYLRNSMGQERLRNSIHRTFPCPEIWTLMFSLTRLLNRKPKKGILIIKILSKNKVLISI